MSTNGPQSKLADTDLGQNGPGADQAPAGPDCVTDAAPAEMDSTSGDFADALGLAVAQWFDRLRSWDVELRGREADLQQQAADVATRRRELARDLRRQSRNRPPHSDTDSQLAKLQSQMELLLASIQQQPSQALNAHLDSAEQAESDGDAQHYAKKVALLQERIDSLIEQNDQLASELAQNTVRRSVRESSDASATLSWEQRKELLYRQYESDGSEDGSLSQTDDAGDADEALQVSDPLRQELANLREMLQNRNTEIAELRALVENRSAIDGTVHTDGELAVGAATFAKMFDGDELVREERARLKELQTEWEAKFRDMEIAASIERANLARERRELERQNAALEEQLAHLQQDLRQESLAGPNQSRRWMAKLGLSE